jgi:DNA-binding CsgD family transcriptional regulator
VNESTPEKDEERPQVDLSSLTDREREVLGVAMSGAPVAAIAETLSLSEATVRSHLAHIYNKLDVTGRMELLARANGTLGVDRIEAQASSVSEPPARRDRRVRAAVLVVATVSIALAAFAILRPDLPPSTNIGSVSTLLSDGMVASLDLRGDRLLVTTVDGRRFRIDGADRAEVEALQAVGAAHDVDLSVGGDTDAALLMMAGALVLPLGVVLTMLMLALTWAVRARRGSPPAAAS